MDKLSVILPVLVFNDYLQRITSACINNIRYQTYPTQVELILIHNRADLYRNIKNELVEGDIYLPYESENLTAGRAINEGMKHATSDYICILANDCYPHFGWYKYAKQAIDSGELDIVIPWMWRINIETYYGWMEQEKYINMTNFVDGAGNCCVFKKETYNKIGPLDENLHIYCDRDYHLRMLPLGIKVGNQIQSCATHLGSMTWLPDNVSENNKDIFGWTFSEACAFDQKYFNEKWGCNT